MESMNKMSIGDSLRQLAVWYDDHPDVRAPYVTIHIWDQGQSAITELAKTAKAFGSCSKQVTAYSFNVSRVFGSLEVTARADRDAICRKRVTYDCPQSLLESLGMSAEDVATAIG